MADKQLSYDYQNSKRDLSDVLSQMIKALPFLISLIVLGTAATATKHEWLEDELAPVSGTLNGAHTDSATTLTMDDTSGFEVGMVLRFETAAGVTVLEQALVTAVASGTQLTVTRGYGGTTAVALTDNSVVIPVAKPLAEATEPGSDAGREPSVAYNYTQIFDRVAKVSKTAEAVKKYGISSALNYQVDVHMRNITRDMNSQLIFGRRVERTDSAKGSFGGIMQFMEGGVVDTTGGDLSMDIINNIFESIFEEGGMSNKYAICVAPNQARNVSALMTKGTVPANQALATAGHAVSKFVGDIPAFQGNPYEAFIAVDPNLPKDQIQVLDLNRISMVPLTGRALTDEDATPNGADYYARRLLGEYTLEVKNGTKAHGKATGLNV